jgi:glyoxylase-like metal-dependent hydrolase (beta-lactamase superfamily II)
MIAREPVDARLPWVRVLGDLDEARAIASSSGKLHELRRLGERLGEELRDGPRVVSVRTLPLRTLLYPTKFAFGGACILPVPFVVMFHRSLLVQVEVGGELKNVLFNPTDTEAAKATPYFAKLIETFGERMTELVSKNEGTVVDQLRKIDLSPEDIDVVAYDHFHTQDVRPIVGTTGPDHTSARFPNAMLLAPRREWDDWDDLHPFQRSWFVRDGKKGVDASRVVLYDADLMLGPGALLLRTPGHTSGNQTIFVHTEGGVFGCSENGTSADNWNPYESRIPGLRAHARLYDAEVVLNSNTPELGLEQYTSMILEKSIVDRATHEPAFPRMFPSSEVTPSALAPGIRPALVFGEMRGGTVRKRARRIAVAAE